MRTQLWQLACLYWTTANLLAFALMGLDKRRARRGCWRISEKALFFFPVLGGSLGGMLGMYFFHHKTRHWYFRAGFPLLFLFQALLLFFLWRWLPDMPGAGCPRCAHVLSTHDRQSSHLQDKSYFFTYMPPKKQI